MGRKKIHIPSIFQGKLEFPAPRGGFSATAEHPLEDTFFKGLLVIFISLVLAYIYFVGASVLNIIARKEALAQTTQLSTVIGGFEKDYFSISHGITPDLGPALGLAPVLNTAYVYRPGAVGQAETSHNEI